MISHGEPITSFEVAARFYEIMTGCCVECGDELDSSGYCHQCS